MEGIFLSYRRDDTPWCAGRLHDVLARLFGPGLLFMDVESIEGGDHFKAKIAKGIADSKIVVVLIGRRWLGVDAATGIRRIDDPEDFVRKEVTEALYQGKAVVPVLVDDATLPERGELPESISRIVDFQAERLRYAEFEQDSRDLIAVVERSVKRPRAPWRMPALTPVRVAATASLCLSTMVAGYWAGSSGQSSLEELGMAEREGGYQQARQDLLNLIHGVVVDEFKVPVVGASIEVRLGNKVMTATTVDGGEFKVNIADLKPQLNDPIVVKARADSFKVYETSFLYPDGIRRRTMVLTK